MPIHEYWCVDCEILWEKLTTKVSDAKGTTPCPVCKKETPKVLSSPHVRMGKLFTAGGPTIDDKDGFESLGMSGEEAQISEKRHYDHTQKTEKEGKDPFEAAVEISPSREMTDEEVHASEE